MKNLINKYRIITSFTGVPNWGKLFLLLIAIAAMVYLYYEILFDKQAFEWDNYLQHV
jgi:hypothetical protein